MPRFGLATLNHSPLHGLPTQWEAHLDAAAKAGFDAIAPDVFWLRQLEEEGVTLPVLRAGLESRGLACMEIAGIAIGEADATAAELDEHVRWSEALGAEFVNARVVEPVEDAIVDRARERFAVGDREEALHLLDILFSQERPSAAALELGIEIHEALQPESANFWLSAWLRNEAEKLGKRLKEL